LTGAEAHRASAVNIANANIRFAIVGRR